MKRADISARVATVPAFGFAHAYTLPPDCLRVWELYGSTAEWVIESGQLLTDQETDFFIRYIRKVEEPAYFSPAFSDCLATVLGSELAAKLADDKQMRQVLLQEFQIKIDQAYYLNAVEGNRPRSLGEKPLEQGNYSWVTEGR